MKTEYGRSLVNRVGSPQGSTPVAHLDASLHELRGLHERVKLA